MNVVALLSDDSPAAALAAGFEEEGVPLAIEPAEGEAEPLALEAAQRSELAIGVGGDGERLILVVAGRRYLEAPVAEARRFGHDAARIAAHRRVRQS
jgi:hypothetical protein